MSEASRLVLSILLCLTGTSLLAQTPAPAITPREVRVAVVVTLDDSPCPDSKVVIRPIGVVEGWPEGNTEIILTTDNRGHASTQLGPGKYKIVVHDPMNTRLPADGWFAIKAGQRQPQKVRLNLLYWDCAKVTCLL
jgi:hypothetical protein